MPGIMTALTHDSSVPVLSLTRFYYIGSICAMKNLRGLQSVLWGAIGLILTAVVSALGGAPLSAQQPWQLFAEQIKREKSAPPNDDKNLPQSPHLPQSAGDNANGSSPNTANIPTPQPSPQPTVQIPPPERPLLDFVGSLGPDAATPVINETDGLSINQTENQTSLPPPVTLPPYRGLESMKNDATLHDVYFLTPKRGWGVGDRGTIWATVDGGANWLLAESHVTDDLYGVSFLDERFGAVVGGSVLDGGKNGRGVILLTDDGGANWTSLPLSAFPILRSVQIRSEREIVVAGDSSELYPAGIFISKDRGNTWNPADRTNRHAGWRKLAYRSDEKRGVGPAVSGALMSLAAGSVTNSVPLSSESVADLSQTTAGFPLWLAGDRGLVLCSDDSGENWRRPDGALPANTGDLFDFSTVFAQGNRVFLAGSPGSRIFFSDDGGSSWGSAATGITVPIQRLFFVDPDHGWGVGALGNIIATSDGGRSWTVQREGGRRLAYLCLLADVESFCPELFVRLSGDEGYLGAVAMFTRRPPGEEAESEISALERLNAATIESLGCGAFVSGRFTAPDRERNSSLNTLFKRYDAENDGRGLEKFRENLVRVIRTYRPDVLVIHDAARPYHAPIYTNGKNALAAIAEYTRTLDLAPSDPLRALIERELPGAIAQAQNPNAWPEQIHAAGLAPWSVEKVERLSSDSQGNIRLADGYSPALGRDISAIAQKARSLLGDLAPNRPCTETAELALATLFDRQGETKHASVFEKIDLKHGGPNRRISAPAMTFDGIDLRQRSDTRRTLRKIANRPDFGGSADSARAGLLSNLDEQRKTLDPELAAEYLLTTGESFARAGQWPLAEEVFSRIASDYPDSAPARSAFLWLIQYYAGSEPFWRTLDDNRIVTSTTNAGTTDVASAQAIDPALTNSRFHNADELGRLVRSLHPEIYMTPEMRFPLAVVQRRRGYDNDALRYYLNRSLLSKDDLWGARAEAEFQLLAPANEASETDRISPLLIASCKTTPSRPYLDGTFEPEVWQGAQRFSLSEQPVQAPPSPNADPNAANANSAAKSQNKAESTEFGTFISLLYDAEFLYIGIEALNVEGVDYSSSDSPRMRDADLSNLDRVEIELDLDRDYTTAYRFEFSHRGDVTDACWDRLDWNCRVFTAQTHTAAGWTLEAAIPWEEIAERAPTKNDVWAAAFRRIVPDRGVECWNAEHSIRTKHAFGLLTFGTR